MGIGSGRSLLVFVCIFYGVQARLNALQPRLGNFGGRAQMARLGAGDSFRDRRRRVTAGVKPAGEFGGVLLHVPLDRTLHRDLPIGTVPRSALDSRYEASMIG